MCLDVRGLSVEYLTRHGPIPALESIDLAVHEGQVFGVVGEYGAGKTTLLEAILGVLPPAGRITDGLVLYRGQNLVQASPTEQRRLRSRRIALIPVNAAERLVPIVAIGDQLANVYRSHIPAPNGVVRERVLDAIRTVGIADPKRVARAYPMELSGGMAQRVMIAMALICDPDLILADDPTYGLDVTIQVQILDLLIRLTDERSAAMLLVTRDATVVSHYCDAVLLLRRGRAVAQGSIGDVLAAPRDTYARAFFDAYAL